jgi:hypothetical protein
MISCSHGAGTLSLSACIQVLHGSIGQLICNQQTISTSSQAAALYWASRQRVPHCTRASPFTLLSRLFAHDSRGSRDCCESGHGATCSTGGHGSSDGDFSDENAGVLPLSTKSVLASLPQQIILVRHAESIGLDEIQAELKIPNHRWALNWQFLHSWHTVQACAAAFPLQARK